MTVIAGLDVGGAHLKVALAQDGHPIAVAQHVCPLWQGLDKLDAALAEAAPLLRRASRFAVTMTGELSDLFPNRKTGVRTLVRRVSAELGAQTQFWIGPLGFGAADEAIANHQAVGSTNFLATATLIGRTISDALLIDFGSTTADIIPISAGAPRPRGLTDAARQATGELVYTGYTRTAVMSIATRAPWNGTWVSLAREYLATMADVRRILGVDLAAVDQHATADGKGKSPAESVDRLARMLGREAADGSDDDWRLVSAWLREAQLRSIVDGALQVLSASSGLGGPVIAAGIGADDVAAIASAHLGRPAIPFGDLVGAGEDCRRAATCAAPAVAVALLAGLA